MTDAARLHRATDTEYHEYVLTGVTTSEPGLDDPGSHAHAGPTWYHFSMKGSGISGPAEGPLPFKPKPGDTLRIYGKMYARSRGMEVYAAGALPGAPPAVLYYLAPDELDAQMDAEIEAQNQAKRDELEANRAARDAQYDALPVVFQRRIDKFRGNNPDFRWEFEPYEVFACEEAVKIAEASGQALAGSPSGPNRETIDTWFAQFHALTPEAQRELAGLSDGHSGNTFGAACRLAYLYATGETADDGTPGVVALHGALAPLVGSEAYGCVPRTEAGASDA